MISATVSGRIGRDAESRSVGGSTVTSFSLASNAFRNKEKTTDWVNVSFWGERGSKLAEHLTKGAFVIVRGTMFVREYDGKDGSKKFSLDVRADDIELGGGGRQDSEGGRRGGGGGANRQSSRRTDDERSDDYGGADAVDDIPF